MDKLTAKLKEVLVLSGHQEKGADQLGERWAFARMVTVERYHAQWDKYGKRAGPLRNQEMVDAVGKDGVLVAFWDGNSPGTRDILARARRAKLKVIMYKV